MRALALQMTNSEYTKIAVVGLGQTGLSCARWFLRKGVSVRVLDTRTAPPSLEVLKREFPETDIRLGALTADALAGIETIVLSPGLSVKDPVIAQCIKNGVRVIGDIELFARSVTAPIVAITGSNGKSTVTTLLGEMAKRANQRVAVGGNIGVPVLELMEQETFELYVLELSSFQLETTYSLKPKAAVVLNISADHLDRYDSIEEYAAAKQTIYSNAETCVVNRDDPVVMSMPTGPDRITFGLDAPAKNHFGLREKQDTVFLAKGEEILMPVSEMKLAGKHNWSNALAALALGESIGLPMSAMLETLRVFAGLPHRTQLVAEQNGVRWYNDSKGTNVGATIAAVAGMSGPVILIAGGEGKGQDFSPLRPVVAEHAKFVILFGRDANLIAESIKNTVPVLRAVDLKSAVRVAKEMAQPGDNVLLSPACASFDMFNNYQHRGDVFVEEVREILAHAK